MAAKRTQLKIGQIVELGNFFNNNMVRLPNSEYWAYKERDMDDAVVAEKFGVTVHQVKSLRQRLGILMMAQRNLPSGRMKVIEDTLALHAQIIGDILNAHNELTRLTGYAGETTVVSQLPTTERNEGGNDA